MNVPATFQANINLALCEYIDQFVIAYFNDIVVYLDTVNEHMQHVQLMLQKLRKFNLFVKLSKYIFDIIEIEFVGFQEGISIELGHIKTVVEWSLPRLFRDIQQFLGFVNFYCRFINAFSQVAAGLSNMLKSREKGKFKGKKFVFTEAK